MLNTNVPYCKVVLGGVSHTVIKLKGRRGFKGWSLIQKTIAPVIGQFFDASQVDAEVAQLDKQDTFERIMTLVADNFDSDEFSGLIEAMLEGCTNDDTGSPINIDDDFQGQPELFMELVLFCLEANFKGFFTGSNIFGSLMGKASQLMALKGI